MKDMYINYNEKQQFVYVLGKFERNQQKWSEAKSIKQDLQAN